MKKYERPFIARWRSAILSAEGPPKASTKAVLAVLAEYADPDGGNCFPSVDSIGCAAGLSKRSVIAHLSEAKELGWLDVHARGRNCDGWMRNDYRPRFPDSIGADSAPYGKVLGEEFAPNQAAIGANNDNQMVQITTANGAESAHDSVHYLDHDLEGAAQGGRRRSRATQLPKSFEPDDTCRSLAIELGVDLDFELAKFRDHAEANERTQKNWQASFRTWLRKAREFDRTRPPIGRASQRRVSPSDHVLSSYD